MGPWGYINSARLVCLFGVLSARPRAGSTEVHFSTSLIRSYVFEESDA